MIPPIVQPGDEFQRVRMPNSAGLAGEALSIASVNGDLAQLEWVVSMSAIYARTTDPLVAGQIWNDGSYLRFSAGAVVYSPSADFSNLLNSQYLALIEDL